MPTSSKIKKSENELIELKRGSLSAKINGLTSELCCLAYNGTDVMWGGGKPEKKKSVEEKEGWPHSEIIMFPTVSLSHKNTITVDGKKYSMGKHGISRHLKHKLLSQVPSGASFLQFYEAGTSVESEKNKDTFYSWPFSYMMKKSYMIKEDAIVLSVEIENMSDRAMPFALGRHPAFKVLGETYVICGKEVYPIGRIKESEGGVVFVENANEATYVSGETLFMVQTNFKHIQLWSPRGQPLVAIEPVTAKEAVDFKGEFRDKPGNLSLRSGESAIYYMKLEFEKMTCSPNEKPGMDPDRWLLLDKYDAFRFFQ